MTRPPLDVAALRPALLAPTGPLARVDVVETAASTNSDLVARARAGSQIPAALVAEHQQAGRGRAGRAWQTPPRAALTVSFLLRPQVPADELGWVPLLTGLALARTLRAEGVSAWVKWPNDVLLPAPSECEGLGRHRKVAGVLAEVVPDAAPTGAGEGQEGTAVVVGVGLNVDQSVDELPVPAATSLALAGQELDRGELLVGLTGELFTLVARWEATGGDAVEAGLAGEYAEVSATLGRAVRAELAGGGDVVDGEAVRVADDGALVLATAAGERVVTAGDVHHLRAV
ncbi:biotin--[acetyl-CoA-carboxylase] ligase [Isoptericola sp. b408]|uniref:biotin--[acetyl-CoA-carboxylase] ligase n=1 Tax=Isoptericola sp. b408 TaxID=3064653 RepID=UPI002713943C|nr:biotin--[acetyl-CoA-carboxylase] ligase [Isoptericola sp. b408]MDO8151699.1 biotin--[acetyl-CoA-carboxylase] ligase [Isoptericola sp. b408]